MRKALHWERLFITPERLLNEVLDLIDLLAVFIRKSLLFCTLICFLNIFCGLRFRCRSG